MTSLYKMKTTYTGFNNNNNTTSYSTYKQFNSEQINRMNTEYPWNGSICNINSNSNKPSNNSSNILLATGDSDLTYGRKYISVNSKVLNMSPDKKEEFKRKHNIIDPI